MYNVQKYSKNLILQNFFVVNWKKMCNFAF